MTQPLDSGTGAAPRFDPATDLAPTEPASPAGAPAGTPPPEWRATAAPLADVIAKPKTSSGRSTSLLLGLAAAVAVGGIAFAAGRMTAPTAAASGPFVGNGQFPGGGQLPGNGQGFPGRNEGFGGVNISGEVTAISADSITVKLASGTEVTVPLDASTAYHKATGASAGDVTVGSTVAVTPGGRVANPGASLDPNASPGPGAGLSFGAATDVTVKAP